MIDWGSRWFQIRSELGHPDTNTMMYQDEGHSFKKFHFPHRTMDGFGKILEIMENEGVVLSPPSRKLRFPNKLSSFFYLLKGLWLHPRLKQNPWKYFQKTSWVGPDEVSYWFLTQDENDRLLRAAKKENLSVGFYLLSKFDRVLKASLFKDPQASSTWLCPVDLRGAIKTPNEKRNWVSFIPATIQDSPHLSYQNFKASLKRGDYWAFWEVYQIGKWIGESGMKRLAKKSQDSSFWMGSFSDLGVWQNEALLKSNTRHRYWVMAPPGSSSYPIGITTLEWCGHRSVTLKIQSCVTNGHDPVILGQRMISQVRRRL